MIKLLLKILIPKYVYNIITQYCYTNWEELENVEEDFEKNAFLDDEKIVYRFWMIKIKTL